MTTLISLSVASFIHYSISPLLLRASIQPPPIFLLLCHPMHLLAMALHNKLVVYQPTLDTSGQDF